MQELMLNIGSAEIADKLLFNFQIKSWYYSNQGIVV